MPLLTKTSSSTWNRTDHYTKTGTSTWSLVPQIYVKTDQGWRPLYTIRWFAQPWGPCSKLCGGGTQSRVVQCVRDDGRVLPDSVCTKHVGAKPAVTQWCNTHTCTYYALGGADDMAMLYSLYAGSRWRCIMSRGGGDRPPVYNAVTSPDFANDLVYMLFAMTDTNGTSYSAYLAMCTAANVCTAPIVYFPKQGECDGGTWYFTWHIPSMTTARYRATGWRHRNQGQCSGCSGATDSGWGYLNCAGGGPAWAYIPVPSTGYCNVGQVY